MTGTIFAKIIVEIRGVLCYHYKARNANLLPWLSKSSLRIIRRCRKVGNFDLRRPCSFGKCRATLKRGCITNAFLYSIFASVAQLVEQRIRNAWVAGSSPAGSSTTLDLFRSFFEDRDEKRNNKMRKMCIEYPILQTVSAKLTWSHYVELLTIDEPMERSCRRGKSECNTRLSSKNTAQCGRITTVSQYINGDR